MKIIITGASGLVATELVLNLLSGDNKYELILVSRNPNKLAERYQKYSSSIKSVSLDELLIHDDESYDICIHTAFARSSSGEKIVESLEYTDKLCKWVRNIKIPKFINISSQSVYGNSYEPFIDENGPCAPGYMYALAKYSSELIIKNIFDDSSTKVVNIRLSSVCENARFIKIFVENTINHSPIKLVAPNQIVSFIDVRDVAEAIAKIITSPVFVAGNYNLGSGQNYSIYEIAQLVDEIGQRKFNLPKTEIIVDDNGTKTKVGMSIKKFSETYNWIPQYDISDMIRSLYNMLKYVNKGGYPQSFKLVYYL